MARQQGNAPASASGSHGGQQPSPVGSPASASGGKDDDSSSDVQLSPPRLFGCGSLSDLADSEHEQDAAASSAADIDDESSDPFEVAEERMAARASARAKARAEVRAREGRETTVGIPFDYLKDSDTFQNVMTLTNTRELVEVSAILSKSGLKRKSGAPAGGLWLRELGQQHKIGGYTAMNKGALVHQLALFFVGQPGEERPQAHPIKQAAIAKEVAGKCALMQDLTAEQWADVYTAAPDRVAFNEALRIYRDEPLQEFFSAELACGAFQSECLVRS